MSSPEAVTVEVRPVPFAPALPAFEARDCVTLGDVLAAAYGRGCFNDDDDLPWVRFIVDGEELAFEDEGSRLALLDRPVAPGAVVGLQVTPECSNDVGRFFFQLAAMVTGHFLGAIPGAAVNMLGMALFPIRNDVLDPATNRANPLREQQNPIRRRQMMPLQLGTSREVLDVAALPYTQMKGNESWLHVIYGIHYGPCSVADIKIGETLLADYPAGDVLIEEFYLPGERTFVNYPQRVSQENLSDEIEIGTIATPGAWEVHTSAIDADRIELDFQWPAGLYFNKPNGSKLQQEVRLEIQWRTAGSGSYVAAPIEGGPYEDRHGATLGTGIVDVMARTQDAVRKSFAWDTGAKGQYDIRVRAIDPDGDDPELAVQETYWTAVRTIERGKPIEDEYLACLGMAIRTTDDLSGSLPVVTAVITPHAPVWDGEVWHDDIEDWTATSNAARVARMMVMGPAAAKPMAASEIDVSCATVHDLIDEWGWTGGYRLASDVTQEDALRVLGLMGRFATYHNGQALCFVPDWEKPAPAQVWTDRNVQGYRYRRVFPDECHGVVVGFRNAEKDYEADEVTVYADDYAAEAGPGVEAAELLENLSLEYSTEPDRAFREGRHWLAKRVLRVESHEWTVGADGLRATFGDRCLVRHSTALYGAADARIQWREIVGDQVVKVRLDNPVVMTAGEDYAVDIRTAAGAVLAGVAVQTVEGLQYELTFADALTDDEVFEGDLLIFGKVGQVTEDLEITDIAPQPGGEMVLRGVRYLAAEIEAAETEPVPPLTSRLTTPPGAPTPRLVGAPVATPEGARVAFDIDPLRAGVVEGFPVRWRRAAQAGETENAWTTLTPVPAAGRQFVSPPIPDAATVAGLGEGEYRVDIDIRCKLRTGEVSAVPLLVEGLLVTRDLPAPIAFAASGATRTAPDNSSRGVIAVSCDPLEAGVITDLIVEIRAPGGTDDDWIAVGQPQPCQTPYLDILAVDPGETYDVAGRWRSFDGFLGQRAVVEDVTVPSGSNVSHDTRNVGGRPDTDVVDATDRSLAGLDASGDLARDIPSSRANSSNLLRRASGGLYTGDLAATESRVFTGSSVTGPFTVNDIWRDTSGSVVITRVRNAANTAWVAAATVVTNTNQLTDGAGLGTTATWAGTSGKPPVGAHRGTFASEAAAVSAGLNDGDQFVDLSLATTKAKTGGVVKRTSPLYVERRSWSDQDANYSAAVPASATVSHALAAAVSDLDTYNIRIALIPQNTGALLTRDGGSPATSVNINYEIVEVPPSGSPKIRDTGSFQANVTNPGGTGSIDKRITDFVNNDPDNATKFSNYLVGLSFLKAGTPTFEVRLWSDTSGHNVLDFGVLLDIAISTFTLP